MMLLHSREEVAAVYNTPLLDLVYKAASVHRMYNDPQMVRASLWPGCHRQQAYSFHIFVFSDRFSGVRC